MRELFRRIQPYTGKIFAVGLITFLSFLFYNLYNAPVDGFEEKFIYLLKQYGYVILFVWSMLEGEMGLIMAGLMAHDGSMNLFLAIFIAGLGGFAGDQVYFYIGRFNKEGVLKRLRGQRRKFAFINLISAWCWAAITIVPVWYFGNQIMVVLHWAKEHWYLAIPIAAIFGGKIIYYFNKAKKKIEKRVMNEN